MQKYLNNWKSTLLAGVSAAATSAQIPAGDAAKLSLSGADYYVMTLASKTAQGGEDVGPREIVHVTAVSGQTLTLLRGQEGTAAAAWSTGTNIEMRVTAAALARHEQATGGGTDLSVTRTATTVTVASSTGDDAPLPAASAGEAGVLSAADKTKLDGIAANATANATNAQLRDRATHTGEQPMSSVTGLSAALDGKQNTEAGKGLSSNDFTTAEKAKLAALESSHFKGQHPSLAALQAAHPTGVAGDYADVDTGAGSDVERYIWDSSDAQWIKQLGQAAALTSAQIKAGYESNPDTNAYTDSEKTKLASVATGATANSTDAQLRARFTHTGLQAISTVSGLEAALAAKQPTETGKGLSSNDYTSAEKTKLAGLESSRFKGMYASLAALQAAHPTGAAGDYADVDAGAGVDVVRYVWDVSDSAWVAIQGSGGSMTPAQVKIAYESNADTNAYTDSEKTKLAAIATGATANQTDAHLLSRANHTGQQATSTVAGLDSALASKQPVAAVITESGQARTLALTDNLCLINCTSSSAATITIPPQSSVAWPASAEIHVRRSGTGAVSIAAGAGVTFPPATTPFTLGAQGAVVTLKRLAQDVWAVIGGDVSLTAAPPTVVSFTSARTLALADAGKYLRGTDAAAQAVTVPPQSSVAWAADTEIHIERGGAGALTIAAGAGVTINHDARFTNAIGGRYGVVTIKRVSADVWTLFGNLEVV